MSPLGLPSRRGKLHSAFVIVFIVSCASQPAFTQNNPGTRTLIKIDARSQVESPPRSLQHMGGGSPSGHWIGVNSQYLTKDGKTWLPVMGEFHYSRYPDQYWEEELLKMKAGGVEIVATYVFWIHHEE